MYTNIFSFGERILPEYNTRDVRFSNSIAQPIKLRCAFNKAFLVNHWRDMFNFSCKWLCSSNSYKPKTMSFFPIVK